MAEALQFVAFRVGTQQFAVEIHRVMEVRNYAGNITPLPGAPPFVEGMIDLRGKLIPVIDMRKRLALSVIENTMQTRILIVRAEQEKLGLIVDEADQVHTVAIEDIHPPPEQGSDFVLAVAKHQDQLLLVLEVEQLLRGIRAISKGERA